MTFDEWFQSKQGEAYDSMYGFAHDAWKASRADAFQLAAERARDLGHELAELNEDDAMEFAGKTIGDSICNRLSGIERECCGTFVSSPHRATCAKYRGKFKERAK